VSDLLTLPRAARACGVPAKWLKAEAEAGRVPCLKAEQRYLFNAIALQEALAVAAAKTRVEVASHA
jgi:hypothetical protein